MKINKTIKGNKITSISLTFEDDNEIGCLEDIIILTERSLLNYFEYRNGLPEIVSNIKTELK